MRLCTVSFVKRSLAGTGLAWLLLVAAKPAAAGSFTYTTLDDPSATAGTQAKGVDGNNIVGQFTDASGTHGFLYNGSTWTTLDDPLASQAAGGTSASGISGNNIVGMYSDASGDHGFETTIPGTPVPPVIWSVACLLAGFGVFIRLKGKKSLA